MTVQYRADYRGMGAWLKGSDARRVTTLGAAAALSRQRAVMAKRTGATAASGRLLQGIGGRRNDRVRVTIAFDGYAAPMQFGNKRVRATRPLTRGLVQR